MDEKPRADFGRSVLNLEQFSEKYNYKDKPRTAFHKRVFQKCSPNISSLSSFQWIFSLFPILVWLPKYNVKKNLASDLVAGFTIAIMHIPQGMAYSLLVGVDPVIGIYTAFFPVLLYSILGTMAHPSMGSTAISCIMLTSTVAEYSSWSADEDISANAPSSPLLNATAGSETMSSSPQDVYTALQVATAMTFCVGMIQFVAGIFQLGFLTVLLTDTLISSFTVGAGVHVLTSQVKNVLGIRIAKQSGVGAIVRTYIDIVGNILLTNYVSLLLSLATIVFCMTVEKIIAPKVKQKCRFPIPSQLIVIIITTAISPALKLGEVYGVRTIEDMGKIPLGLPEPVFPPPSLIPKVFASSVAPAAVSYSIALSLGKLFGSKYGYEVQSNQELLAQGASNIFGSCFSCLPMAAAMSRSVVQESSGCRSLLTSVVSSLSLLAVMLAIGPLFHPLPVCVLGGIIISSLYNILRKVTELNKFWKRSQVDGSIWIITVISIIFLSIEVGLLIGVTCSLAVTLYRAAAPQVRVLGRNKEGVWIDSAFHTTRDTDTRVIQISGPLYFLVLESVRMKILKELGISSEKKANSRYKYVVLDISNVTYLDQKGGSLVKWMEDQSGGLELVLVATQVQVTCLDNIEAQVFPTYIDAVLSIDRKRSKSTNEDVNQSDNSPDTDKSTDIIV